MPDHRAPELPRIALLFGDAAEAAHLREAVRGLADVVYAASAEEFDAARLAEANVAAALVNVDGGDWLEGVEASLDAAGITAIYNDPDISRGLEGWARARWLRHLLAKLRGSTEVDPPRPEPARLTAGQRPIAVAPRPSMPTGSHAAVIERPLSPQEIETMTADFVAVPQAAPTGASTLGDPGARAAAPESERQPVDSIGGTTSPFAATADAQELSDEPGRAGDADLDVDTETLSAMIDARLADSESRTPSDSPEVWRLVEGGPAAAVQPPSPPKTGSGVAPAAAPVRTVAAAQDDSDVLASLPALDDWQLVDPDAPSAAAPAPAAAAAASAAQPADAGLALSEALAGLELVPMERVMTGVEIHTDPIERWLHDSEPAKNPPRADGAPRKAGGAA